MVLPAPGFDPGATLAGVDTERCTSLYGVPTMFIGEWSLPDFDGYDLSCIRTGIMAGSPCPANEMTKRIDSGIEQMTICYGMTETSPVSTQNRTERSFELKVGTVGRVCPHLQAKVADPLSGETLPRGEAGEFCTKGYSVMIGYWNEPEKTAEVLQDGWLHTGGLVVMHGDGWTGRGSIGGSRAPGASSGRPAAAARRHRRPVVRRLRRHPRPARLIRDQDTTAGTDLALFTTDSDIPSEQIIERYADRWTLETSNATGKQILGVGQARNRVARAVERTIPFEFLIQTIVTLWYATSGYHHDDLTSRLAAEPWYRGTTEPTFEDMLARLRRTLIAARFTVSAPNPLDPNIIHDDELACAAAAA